MSVSFKTIAQPSSGVFRDRGSKFLAFAFSVRTEDEAKRIVKKVWEENPGVCHVCYAYRIGVKGEMYRANDDGEPSGSAGLPILNQIKSKEVTNTLVAIARHFGGTKLGVSGLINAYKEATKLALENAEIVESVIVSEISLQFPHSSIGEVERVIAQNRLKIVSQDFGMDCQWKIEMDEELLESVKGKFSTIKNVVVKANS